MKTTTLLLLVLLPACARSEATPKTHSPEKEVRCELLKIEGAPEADPVASFRVVNDTSTAITYVGFGKDSPMYQVDVEEQGAWVPYPMGWCGTGSSTIALEPGESQVVNVIVPADGRSYRFRFGEPPVVTPAVTAGTK